jgi:formyl-CoA transferase
MVVRATSHQGWEVPMAGVVPKFTGTPGSVRSAGPALGAHTREVLTNLAGVDPEELTALEAAGIVSL